MGSLWLSGSGDLCGRCCTFVASNPTTLVRASRRYHLRPSLQGRPAHGRSQVGPREHKEQPDAAF